MSQGVPYADILILALIAGFILLRLRSVLGQHGAADDPDFLNRLKKPAAEVVDPIVQLPEKLTKTKQKEEPDTYLALIEDEKTVAALNAVKAKDAQFTAGWFLNGAHYAFEMVFDAFNKGDKPTLKNLLSDALYQQFSDEIDARDKQENRADSTLVAITAKDIVQASVNGNLATIKVKFVSEQIHLVRDQKGAIVQGNPSQTSHVEDEWVFERELGAKNPNWKIIET